MGEQSTNYLYRRKTSSSYSSLIGGLWAVWVCKYCRWFDKISYFLRLLSHFTLESADDIYKHLHTFQNCKYGHASTDGQMEGANSSHSTSRYLSIKTSSIQEEG
ncbi:hypothetical protein AcW1_001042 [Taiwanofungus camphoratus]|nr:hypothetical protein AcW1_001042 [Antrodia cinnamomea]